MTQNFGTNRYLPPAQKGQALFFADDLKQLFGLVAAQLLLREKEHADAVFPLIAQRDAAGIGGFLEELVADLQQNAHAVAGLALGVLTCTMLQMLHDLQSVIQRLVALAALDVHHRADAAVVVLKAGIVQPGGGCALGKVTHGSLSSVGRGKAAPEYEKGVPGSGRTCPNGNAFVLDAIIP